jgi:hypothetical protein
MKQGRYKNWIDLADPFLIERKKILLNDVWKTNQYQSFLNVWIPVYQKY